MKKGFTLIELLAVIVIIGLISVLIIPKVQNTLKESKQKTYEASAHALQREADNFYIMKKTEKTSFDGCTYDFTNNTNTCNGFEFTGEKPESGSLIINKTGNMNFALKFDEYCYIKFKNSNEITIQPYNEETCKASISFAEDSWTTIKANLTANRNAYNIGDTKEVVIDNISYTVRLANTSSCPDNWPEAASQTTCGVVIEFIDTIKDSTNNNTDGHKMSSSLTNVGGWSTSSMRSYLNETIFNKLPEELKASGMILDTSVVSGHGSTEGETNFTSIDKLYLLSYVEVWGVNHSWDSVKLVSETVTDGTRQLEYYGTTGSTRIKNKIEGAAYHWWLRSASSIDAESFLSVTAQGSMGSSSANSADGVAPAFRILN